MAAKLAVSGIIDLVVDMATDAKREMRTNTFGMPFAFLSLYWFYLIILNLEVRRFSYYGMARRDIIHLVNPKLLNLG